MKYMNLIAAVLIVGFFGHAFAAQAPEGSTAECKDGSYWSGASKKGACSRHGGIKEWYGTAAAEAPAAQQQSSAPMGPPESQPQQQTQRNPTKPSSRNVATSGGAGQVWVNTDSKVYHCPGARYYGTTKHGEYMSESQAISQGNRADHNKACGSK